MENHSSAMNITIRFAEPTKKHMPAVIVGSSLGAMVALDVARIAPAPALVLIAPALGFGARWTEKFPAGESVPFFHHGEGRELPIHRRFFEQMAALDLDGQPVGTLMVTFEWSDWRCGWWWWIQSVYVAPGHRRKGVYRALYAHVLGLAKLDPEVCGLRLYVERDNINALRTYEFLGMLDAGYRMYEVELRQRPKS